MARNRKKEPYMLDIIYDNLASECDFVPIKKRIKWTKQKQKEYLDDIREWLISYVGSQIEMKSGRKLDVVREKNPKDGHYYINVKYKDGVVYAVREQ